MKCRLIIHLTDNLVNNFILADILFFGEPSEEMLEKWEKAHKEYVEKVAWIKQMLSM